MSEINSFNDYSSKYNTNQDYSFLFGATQAAINSKQELKTPVSWEHMKYREITWKSN